MKVARIYLRVMSFSEDDCTEYGTVANSRW